MFLGCFPIPTWNPGVLSASESRLFVACLHLDVLFPAQNFYLEKRIVWDNGLKVVRSV